MPNVKPLEDTSQDFAADLAALRGEIAKLTAAVSALVHAEASHAEASHAEASHAEASGATASVLGAVDQAQRKISERAADAKERIGAISPEIEAAIERNPLTAVLIAMAAGLLIGMLSRSGK